MSSKMAFFDLCLSFFHKRREVRGFGGLGFSQNELVFVHKVRGPLGTLADSWKDVEPPVNLIIG